MERCLQRHKSESIKKGKQESESSRFKVLSFLGGAGDETLQLWPKVSVCVSVHIIVQCHCCEDIFEGQIRLWLG